MSDPWETTNEESVDAVVSHDPNVEKIVEEINGTVTEAELENPSEAGLLPAVCRALNAILERQSRLEKILASMGDGTLAALKRLEESSERSIAGLTAVHELVKKAPAAPPVSRPAFSPQRGGGYGGRGGSPAGRQMSDEQKLERAKREIPGLPDCGPDWFGPETLDERVGFGKHKEVTWGSMLSSGDQMGYLVWLVKSSIEKAGPDPTVWGRGQAGAQIALWALKHKTGQGTEEGVPPF